MGSVWHHAAVRKTDSSESSRDYFRKPLLSNVNAGTNSLVLVNYAARVT